MKTINYKLNSILSSKSQILIGFFATLFLILTISYFAFGTYRNWHYKVESDGKYYYQYLVSLVNDRDIDFTNDYNLMKPDWMVLPVDPYGQRGHINSLTHKPSNLWTIGPAILWFPFYLVTWLIGYVTNLYNPNSLNLNPWGQFMQYGTMFSAVVYTLLTLWLIYRLLQDYFQIVPILQTIALLLFGSNLVYYSVFEASMSHVYDLFSLVLFVYCFKKVFNNLNKTFSFFILGASGGLHTLVRTQNVLTILFFAGLLTCLILQNPKYIQLRQIWNFLLFIATYFLACLPVFLVNYYLFDNPFTIPQGSEFFSEPHFWEILFSTHNGLFLFNPVLFIGFIGFCWLLVRSWRKRTGQELILFVLLVAFVAQVVVNSSVQDWWGGDSFGQRRLVGSYLIFAIGLAYLLEKMRNWSKLASIPGQIFLWTLVPANLFTLYLFVFQWIY